MHLNSLLLFREHVRHRIPSDGRVLEIGADGLPSTFLPEAGNPPGWDTADLKTEAGRWSGDGSKAQMLMPSEYEIPVADDTYDVVLSGQVIEHVRENLAVDARAGTRHQTRRSRHHDLADQLGVPRGADRLLADLSRRHGRFE